MTGPSLSRLYGVRRPSILLRAGRTLVLGGGVVAAGPALAVELIGEMPDDVVAVASDDPGLDSVLVDRRQGEPFAQEGAPGLEPISRVSEGEPELADPAARDLPPDGAVAPAALEQNVPAEPRLAALPAHGDRVLADVATAYRQENKPQPARFHGVTPGVSTRAELITSWGQPARTATADGDTLGGEVLGYDLEPFEQVEALVEEGTVTVVRVTLADQATVEDLTSRLKLEEFEPVAVTDPRSNELLAVAFPEKGLTLLVKPTSAAAPLAGTTGSAGVSHLVLEPIDARAFVLRAEQRPPQELKAKQADLRAAVEADPSDAHARWLAATQHLTAGQAADAEASAREAIRLAPTNPAYRVTLAESLFAVGEFDDAVLETRKVLDDASAPEIVRAQALRQMGELAALGSGDIAAKTIDFHNAAIEIADRLATSTDDGERSLAKGVLVASHLAVAREVARRDYADKAETVAAWVGRASGLAEDWIATDDGGLELRMRVARESLAALSKLRPTKDPSPWLTEAQETADTLLADSDDPLFRARVHWELGEAFQHAVRIEHQRGDAQQALGYGTRAIRELSAGAEPRTTSPAAEQLVGQLYFYLGAINAVHKKDHAEAVGWYDKGRQILTDDRPESEFVVPRRDGEELVSMGVSYWDQGEHDLAVELTEQGARLMERGVTAGVIKESALAVPYGNLEAMYKKLENSPKATEYARLARGVRSAVAEAKPKAEPVAVAKRNQSASTQPQRRVNPTQPEQQAPRGRFTQRPTSKRSLMR